MKNSVKEAAYKVEIGERLKVFRESKGISLRDFEKIAGKNFSNLAKIEKGERGINEQLLYALITAYPNFNIKWLLTGYGQMEE